MTAKQLPIENPVRISRFNAAISQLEWTSAKQRASLEVLFRRLSELTQAEIFYYYDRRQSARIRSARCRFFAWISGSFGLLVPLIHPVLDTNAPINFLSWGYVAFGLAGVVLMADSVFAGTQANQRYVKTQIELEQIYTVFSLEWQKLLVEFDSEPKVKNLMAFMDLAIVYVNKFHNSMGNETSEWRKDLNDGVAELKGKIASSSKGNQ